MNLTIGDAFIHFDRTIVRFDLTIGDASSASGSSKTSAALLRIAKDLADLDVSEGCQLTKVDDMTYEVKITSDSGYWKNGVYRFKITFPINYPFAGPKVLCLDKIYHPNIDLDGGVCVNVLRPWKPHFTLQNIIFGLLFLFTDPNASDPLNQDAARIMREDLPTFAKYTQQAMKGQAVQGVTFPKNPGLK